MNLSGSQEKPNAIITGSGTWSIKLNNGSEDALENFKVTDEGLRLSFRGIITARWVLFTKDFSLFR